MGSRGRVSGGTQEGSSEELDLIDRVGVGVEEWEGQALECIFFRLPQKEDESRMVVETEGE